MFGSNYFGHPYPAQGYAALLEAIEELSGTVDIVFAVDANLYVTWALSGAIDAAIAVDGNIFRLRNIDGQIDAVAAVDANIHPFRGISGTVDIVTSLTAELFRLRDTSGTVDIVASLTANLYVTWALTGTIDAVVNLVASLMTHISEPFRPPVGRATGESILTARSRSVERLAARGIIPTPILPGRGVGSCTPAAFGRAPSQMSGFAGTQAAPRPGSAGVAPGTAPVEPTTLISHGRYQQSNNDLHIETGFQPGAVWIGSDDDTDSSTWCARLRITSTDEIMRFEGGLVSSQLKSFDSDGFTLTGGASWVNQSGSGNYYNWIAWKSTPGVSAVGKYLGDGEATQEITGLGFQPGVVMILRESDGSTMRTVMLTDVLPEAILMGLTHAFSESGIVSLDADGFTVDLQSNGYTNTNGETYHYIALKNTEGLVATGSYSGDGADDRNIDGVGFDPVLVTVHGWRVPTLPATVGVWRSENFPADPDKSSGRFDRSLALANAIQDLTVGGFQIGSHNFVNNGVKTYYWVAVKDVYTPPGQLEGRGHGKVHKIPVGKAMGAAQAISRGAAGAKRTMEGKAKITDGPTPSGKAR